MIVDDVKITVIAGRGGKGLVTFNRTKMTQGPTGGNGGNGGNVFIEGVSDLSALRQFRFKKENKAGDGQIGKSRLNDGQNAEDLILYVPVGTIARILQTEENIEINKIGQRELVATGGHGGIGLPNVGKSSLLNELTNAKSKVANYPFTTLEPNLAVYFDLILADIPGLIKGAGVGKGLGIKFLRHIERTKVLFHFVSAESDDPVRDYKNVRSELETYNKLLLDKPEYIFISKSDMVLPDVISKIKEQFKKIAKGVLAISIIDFETVKDVKKILNDLILDKKI